MRQGPDGDAGLPPLPVAAAQADYVLLTHAHIDHAGMLPLLKKQGFRGKVYATAATADLCSIMLKDSAHIQEQEAMWRNRKARRAGEKETEPLFTVEDAQAVMEHFVPCAYGDTLPLAPGLSVRFCDMGHLLGSACVRVWAEEGGREYSLCFSGDIGNANQPLLRDPAVIDEADCVIMEATYGDRLHETPADYASELARVIGRALERGGNVVIPAFAVGRTQEILYFLRQVKERGLLGKLGGFPVYLDSPLANEATTVFLRHEHTCYDSEAAELTRRGVNPIGFEGLRLSLTSEDSKAINTSGENAVIISASGMCDAGRIRHHLKHNLWRRECAVVFTGYQAYGTTGRALLEGAKRLKLFGETVDVNAEIVKLQGISGHADKAQLLAWAGGFNKGLCRFFVVHGESHVCDSFAALLASEQGRSVFVPGRGGVWDITADKLTAAGSAPSAPRAPKKPAADTLRAALEKLAALAARRAGAPNRELRKMTAQIEALCREWETGG
jgi:metallo-beta-lactamase family protein